MSIKWFRESGDKIPAPGKPRKRPPRKPKMPKSVPQKYKNIYRGPKAPGVIKPTVTVPFVDYPRVTKADMQLEAKRGPINPAQDNSYTALNNILQRLEGRPDLEAHVKWVVQGGKNRIIFKCYEKDLNKRLQTGGKDIPLCRMQEAEIGDYKMTLKDFVSSCVNSSVKGKGMWARSHPNCSCILKVRIAPKGDLSQAQVFDITGSAKYLVDVNGLIENLKPRLMSGAEISGEALLPGWGEDTIKAMNEYTALSQKPDRTKEEEARLKELAALMPKDSSVVLATPGTTPKGAGGDKTQKNMESGNSIVPEIEYDKDSPKQEDNRAITGDPRTEIIKACEENGYTIEDLHRVMTSNSSEWAAMLSYIKSKTGPGIPDETIRKTIEIINSEG